MKTVEQLAKECGLIHPDWPNEAGSKRIYGHELEKFAEAYMQDRLGSLEPVAGEAHNLYTTPQPQSVSGEAVYQLFDNIFGWCDYDKDDYEQYSENELENNKRILYTAPQQATMWKDHNTRELVNKLTDVAKEYGQTQQLRDRISSAIQDYVAQAMKGK